MGRGKSWSGAEIQTLIDLYPTHTAPEIAEFLNKSSHAVEMMTYKLRMKGQIFQSKPKKPRKENRSQPKKSPKENPAKTWRSAFTVHKDAILLAKT